MTLNSVFFFLGFFLWSGSISLTAFADESSTVQNQNQIKDKIIEQEEVIESLLKKYREKLGPDHDPFALAFSSRQGAKIFRRLTVRKRNGKWVESPLGKINSILRKSYAEDSPIDLRFTQKVIREINSDLKDSQLKLVDLQSNLIALKYIIEYFNKFSGRSGLSDPQSQEDEPEDTPEAPDLKDDDPSDDESFGDNGSLEGTPDLDDLSEGESGGGGSDSGDDGSSGGGGGGGGDSGDDSSADEMDSDESAGSSDGGGGGGDSGDDSSADELDSDESAGSSDGGEASGDSEGSSSDGSEAGSGSESSGQESGENDESQESESNQSDGSERGGDSDGDQSDKSGDKAGSDQSNDDVDSGAQGDSKEDESGDDGGSGGQGESDEYGTGDEVGSGDQGDSEEDDSDDADSDGPGDSEEDGGEDSSEVGDDKDSDPSKQSEKETENRSKDKLEDRSGRSDRTDKPSQTTSDPEPGIFERILDYFGYGNKKNDSLPPPQDIPPPIDRPENLPPPSLESHGPMELGSLEIKPNLDRNIFLDRIIRVLFQISLDPNQTGLQVMDHLGKLSFVMQKMNVPEIQMIYQKALSAHQENHLEIKPWIERLASSVNLQDPNKTFQEIHRLKLSLKLFSDVLDAKGQVKRPTELLALLEEAQKKMREMISPDSPEIALVQNLVKRLPMVPRLLLKNDYGLTTVGVNPATRQVAAALRNGRLNDLKLVSLLSPVSDFILNSTPRPETRQVRTLETDLVRQRGHDFLTFTRWSDLPRSVMGQPGKSVDENILDGTAFVMGRRRRINLPSFTGKEEADRITIVLYDTSGSMAGEPERFQAGLVAAFVGKALSDVSTYGRHRHRVFLVPFDEKPGTPIRVTQTAQALDIIRNYREKLKSTWGGTNIQLALLEAMNLISNAEKQAGEPLAAANIVLMTDGLDVINSEELLTARKAISRRTPLQTMFVAIDQSNEELMKFAMDSKKIGVEHGFYREFKRETIRQMLNEADTLTEDRKDAIFIEKLPEGIQPLMNQMVRAVTSYVREIQVAKIHPTMTEYLEKLERLKFKFKTRANGSLEKWLIQTRKFFLEHPIFLKRSTLDRVIHDLIVNFDSISGIPLSELNDREQEQLRHILQYAITQRDGM